MIHNFSKHSLTVTTNNKAPVTYLVFEM